MPDEGKSDRASWLVPAVVAAAVTLLTTFLATTVQWVKDSTDNDREVRRIDREDAREIAKLRADILKAANDGKDVDMAALLLEHVLKPIDKSPDLDAFSRKVLDHIATTVVQAPVNQVRQDLQQVIPPTDGSVEELISKFDGAERLAASNALVERARTHKPDVVAALIGALRSPQSPNPYRVNLYIAFTLSRMPGGWNGTQEQVAKIQQLRETAEYRDPTFRARVDEALKPSARGS